MSMLIAALMFVPLLAIALAHFIWSLGRSWPIRDRALLAQTVMGMPGVARVPRLPSLLVSAAVLAAGVIALALADDASGGPWLTALGLLLALVFLGRGVLGYTPWFRALTPIEPFRTLDRKTYSPLCLALGAGYLLLVLMRLL